MAEHDNVGCGRILHHGHPRNPQTRSTARLDLPAAVSSAYNHTQFRHLPAGRDLFFLFEINKIIVDRRGILVVAAAAAAAATMAKSCAAAESSSWTWSRGLRAMTPDSGRATRSCRSTATSSAPPRTSCAPSPSPKISTGS